MSSGSIHETLRANLVRHMDRRGMSQRALSRKAELDETTVKQILNGRSKSPRLDTVARLARALDIDVATLIGEERSTTDVRGVVGTVIGSCRRAGLMTLDDYEADAVATAIANAIADPHAAAGTRVGHADSLASDLAVRRRDGPAA